MSGEGVLDQIFAGFEAIGDDPRIVAMWVIAAALLYVGVAKRKEPLLLVPISMGILFANLPLGEFIRAGGEGEPTGILRTFQTVGLESDIFPLLIFLGVGTATDFSPMLSNPKTLLLGAGAQAGVFFALVGALILGALGWFDFGLLEAASIGIIGGADGPYNDIHRDSDERIRRVAAACRSTRHCWRNRGRGVLLYGIGADNPAAAY